MGEPIRIGLMGFGRAGKAVASVLLQSEEVRLQWVVRKTTQLEHRSVPEFLGTVSTGDPGLIYSKDEYSAKELLSKIPVDLIVDFSSENGIEYYGKEAGRRGVAVITAISKYSSAKIRYLKQLSRRTSVLWSPNITIGINFLMEAARILKDIAPYTDIEIIEEHFKKKPEVSGTARKIADCLNIPDVKSIRAGGIIGTHEVIFGFPYQTVRLKHESISREAFGNGALFAARNMKGKRKGLYTMEDFLLPYFRKRRTP